MPNRIPASLFFSVLLLTLSVSAFGQDTTMQERQRKEIEAAERMAQEYQEKLKRQEKERTDFNRLAEAAKNQIRSGKDEEFQSSLKRMGEAVDRQFQNIQTVLDVAEQFLRGNMGTNDQRFFLMMIEEKNCFTDLQSRIGMLMGIADILSDQGRYAESEAIYLRMMRHCEQVSASVEKLKNKHGTHHRLSQFLTNYHLESINLPDRSTLARLYRNQGRYGEAEFLFKESLTFREATMDKNSSEIAEIVGDLSLLYRLQGRYAEAEAMCKRSLVMFERLLGDYSAPAVNARKLLSEIYVSQGRYNDAEPLCRDLYDFYRRSMGRSNPLTIVAMAETAHLDFLLDHPENAETLYKRALGIQRNILNENHPMLAETLNNLGFFYLARQRFRDAEPLLKEALHIRETMLGEKHPATALSMENLARLYDIEGNVVEAETFYNRSIAAFLATPVAARDGCLRYANRARFYHKIDRFEKAVADLKRAIELSLEVRKHASGTEEQRSQTFAGFYTLFETMVDWQYEHGDMNEAYDAMERSRAQGLQDLIDTHGIDFFSGMNPADEKRLRTEDASVRVELASIEKQLDKVDAIEGMSSAEKDRRKQELLDKLREAQRKFVEVQATIRAASPIYRMSVGEDRKPISLSTVQAELQNSKGIALEYLIGMEKSFVLLYGSTGQPRLLPLRLSETEAKLFGVEPDWLTSTKMDFILQNKEETGILQLVLDEKHRTATGNPDSETIAKLATLWNILIPDEGIREQLTDGKSFKQLLILPDGPLARLPFEMLAVEADPTNPQYLLDQGPATVYAPSASLYFNLKSKKYGNTDRKTLTVGDPMYATSERSHEADRDSEETSLMAVSASRNFSRFGKLLQLPWTAREVDWIFDTCSKAGNTTTKLVKTEATEANVRNNMSGRQIVHLACHGLVDDSYGNLFGSLALTIGDSNDAKNDGFLTLAEMFSLDLKSCELAILSACETNIGPNQHGEGTWSMGRGMLASGAKRVVTTNWQVADDASAYLVYDFVATLVGSREIDVAESLHEAKRTIRNNHEHLDWRHPYYWAPFVLIGPN